MKRIFVCFLFFFLAISYCFSQDIHVKSFSLLENDLSARTNPVFDLNDDPCALIKMQFPESGFAIAGSQLVGEISYKNNEYYFYLVSGCKGIKITHWKYPSVFVDFSEFGVDRVEGKYTYQLVCTIDNSYSERITPPTHLSKEAMDSYEEGIKLYDAEQFKDALPKIQYAADSNVPDAISKLGSMYYNGYAVEKNIDKSNELFHAAAVLGSSQGQVNLGESYLDGDGVPKDPEKAFFWLSKAAEQNNPSAIYLLGLCYLDGIKVNVDYQKTLEYFEKAFSMGLSTAGWMLGRLYTDNYVSFSNDLQSKVNKDIAKGKAYLIKATELSPKWGAGKACEELQFIAYKEKNVEDCRHWIEKGCELKNPTMLYDRAYYHDPNTYDSIFYTLPVYEPNRDKAILYYKEYLRLVDPSHHQYGIAKELLEDLLKE